MREEMGMSVQEEILPGGLSKRRKGFTLTELLISLFVIAIGLLGMVLGNTHVQQGSESAHERMVATQDAHRVIELMRNTSANGNFPDNVATSFPNGRAVAGFNNLNSEQVVVTYADPEADPLNITVTTTWRERGVRIVSTQLRTLMTKR
jgi:prepilin-type N-terminal cleavage/methylation domain-containing protein